MKIFIRLLKGDQFEVEVDPADEVSVLKAKVEAARPDLPADRQKLIHTGKILSNETTIQASGIAEGEFIVCMVTKEVAKPKTAAPAPAPAPAAPALAPAPLSSLPVPPAPAPAPSQAAPSQAAAPGQFESAEAVSQLQDMGFPENEVRAALRAAFGNTSVAVEYLMSGIPAHAAAGHSHSHSPAANQSATTAAAAASPGAAPGGNLEDLRRHPQFNMLKRLVQQNPAALGRVLEAIGQQNPELLRAIHSNQQAFLAMMNEPIVDEPAPAPGATPGSRNPAELIQLLLSMPEEMRGQAAAALGMSPEQLQGLTQMLSSMPPDQLQQVLGGMGQEGGGRAGQNVIRLTEEEMASVTRLTELGFDQQDALAAYLACDKNEALAANLLLEGWQAGGDGGEMDMGGEDDFEGGDDMYS